MSGPIRGGPAQSDTGTLQSVLLKHPRAAFKDAATIAAAWRGLNYLAPPDPGRAAAEYDRFAAHLEEAGARIHWLPPDDVTTLDSLYVRDASIPSSAGMILCNMGKPARATEPAAQAEAFRKFGIPVAGAVTGDGRIEGGDVVWLDATTLAVGRGYRTNDEGIRQVGAILGAGIEIVVAPLPHWRGPADVFHLMSILSPIDRDLALVYSPLLPVPFRERLLARGFGLVEVPDEELESMGCNVLALGPRRCLMLDANPVTRSRLEKAGAQVTIFPGDEICRKGSGGPTCLTRPILRS
ncbi:MAG TPA: arginine deiminase family protein [Candidatus Polarisedimenticolia bacterium]|nr:arginine deiminase family protein [Candidatus Polarisedimenticolia bacterium]